VNEWKEDEERWKGFYQMKVLARDIEVLPTAYMVGPDSACGIAVSSPAWRRRFSKCQPQDSKGQATSLGGGTNKYEYIESLMAFATCKNYFGWEKRAGALLNAKKFTITVTVARISHCRYAWYSLHYSSIDGQDYIQICSCF